jgi:hypothetical protein
MFFILVTLLTSSKVQAACGPCPSSSGPGAIVAERLRRENWSRFPASIFVRIAPADGCEASPKKLLCERSG